MTKGISMREFKEFREVLCTVVSFKDGKRTLTYSGLNYLQAHNHILAKQKQGEICLLIPMGNFGIVEKVGDRIEDYIKYLQNQGVEVQNANTQ